MPPSANSKDMRFKVDVMNSSLKKVEDGMYRGCSDPNLNKKIPPLHHIHLHFSAFCSLLYAQGARYRDSQRPAAPRAYSWWRQRRLELNLAFNPYIKGPV
jgi:hypothetical protein